jgi:hypothetical protein
MLALGMNPCIVNPSIANRSRRKTDKLDAKMLALQAMMGPWPKSIIATPQQEAARLACKHRLRLLRERSRVTSQLNNTVLRWGHTFAAHLTDDDGAVGLPPRRHGLQLREVPVLARAGGAERSNHGARVADQNREPARLARIREFRRAGEGVL